MRLLSDSLISAPVDISANWESAPIAIDQMWHYCFVGTVASGTAPTGTFKLQMSADPVNSTALGTNDNSVKAQNWVDVPNKSVAITDNGNIVIEVQNAGYSWVKVVYTKTSGTGNLTYARINAKGF